MVGTNLFAARERQAANLAILDQDIIDLARKAEFAAECLDARAHVLDHFDQAERADMRLADVEDFLGSACFDELVEYFASVVPGILDLAVQLAIGKGSGTPFAELHIGFRVKGALLPEAPGVPGALAHGLAAFEDQRAQAHLREHQRSQDSARAGTDNDRAQRSRWQRSRANHELIGGVRRLHHMRITAEGDQQFRVTRRLDIECVSEMDR